ncbi:MAG: hypothetical protein JXR73_09445 [Candidatus Omnitrophica bacterium]|nr:hypothetical protein [Candidatus Omnitrophota bacterium]
MNIVCKKCFRVLKNNQWIQDVLPIEKVSYTVCPSCQMKEGSIPAKSYRGMVYQEKLRQKTK